MCGQKRKATTEVDSSAPLAASRRSTRAKKPRTKYDGSVPTCLVEDKLPGKVSKAAPEEKVVKEARPVPSETPRPSRLMLPPPLPARLRPPPSRPMPKNVFVAPCDVVQKVTVDMRYSKRIMSSRVDYNGIVVNTFRRDGVYYWTLDLSKHIRFNNRHTLDGEALFYLVKGEMMLREKKPVVWRSEDGKDRQVLFGRDSIREAAQQFVVATGTLENQ